MAHHELLTITSTITLPDDAQFPAESALSVKLVDADGEVLAASALNPDETPTTMFLVADPALVASPDRLFIWAALRSADAFWGTTDLVPVAGDEVAVTLTKIEQ
jgi:putative lipoprotein